MPNKERTIRTTAISTTTAALVTLPGVVTGPAHAIDFHREFAHNIPAQVRFYAGTDRTEAISLHRSQPDYAAYVRAYLDAVRGIPEIECVYVDESRGLHIFTVYRGSIFSVVDRLSAARIRAMNYFPYLPVDFDAVPVGSLDGSPTPESRRVFPAA